MRSPSIFSFFSGAGFLDLGFEKGGYNIVYANEISQSFMKSYKHARHALGLPEPRYGYFEDDISKLLEGKYKSELNHLVKDCTRNNEIVGFIGGPPCPDFSVGGKNRGAQGDNGKLSDTYVQLICQQKPAFFLFENVKGLWRTKKHRAFYDKMKTDLHKSGYETTERVISSIEYGVPQHRERIILIGFHKDFLHSTTISNTEQHVFLDALFPWNNHIIYPAEEVFALPWPGTEAFAEDSEYPCPPGIHEELTVEYWFRKNNVVNHPNAEQHFQPRAGRVKFESIYEGDDSKKSYKRLHRWRYSPTAAYGNNEVHLHPYKVRRISVAEALAIQSLPENFVLPLDISLTDAFKTVGNGVPYLASKAVARTILDFLEVAGCGLQQQKLLQQSGIYKKTELILT